jgi:hypothetical protein
MLCPRPFTYSVISGSVTNLVCASMFHATADPSRPRSRKYELLPVPMPRCPMRSTSYFEGFVFDLWAAWAVIFDSMTRSFSDCCSVIRQGVAVSRRMPLRSAALWQLAPKKERGRQNPRRRGATEHEAWAEKGSQSHIARPHRASPWSTILPSSRTRSDLDAALRRCEPIDCASGLQSWKRAAEEWT